MSRRVVAAASKPVHLEVKRVAEEILDRLPVTDIQYFHLEAALPLTLELAARVRAAHRPPARVLIIGPESLLPLTLLRLGYGVDVWRSAQGFLADELTPRVVRTVTPGDLAPAAAELGEASYDAIVAPLILDGLPDDALPVMRGLRRALGPDGSLILATTNVGQLSRRLSALSGGKPPAAPGASQAPLGWPSPPLRRPFHRDEVVALATDAGLRVREAGYVIARNAFTGLDRMTVGEFCRRQGEHWLMRRLPATRHAILVHLSPRLGDEADGQADTRDAPFISSIVSADDPATLRSALAALVAQDYPTDRSEVIVLHTDQAGEIRSLVDDVARAAVVPVRGLTVAQTDGPAARNAGMAAAIGGICAHTDAACLPHAAWLRTIAAAFDDATGLVAGPVLDKPGSHPPFLAMPGTRPGAWPYRGLYSIFNVAYRRGAALAAGGFIGAAEGDPAPLFWDTDLAYRVQRLGWAARYERNLILHRFYRPPDRYRWVREQWRMAQELPQALDRTPELRRSLLHSGIFLDRQTVFFDLVVVAMAGLLLRRQRRWLALALPWLTSVCAHLELWPLSRWRPSLRLLAGLTLRHVIWFIGLVCGSIKTRRVVL
jgi:hypothetical protein